MTPADRAAATALVERIERDGEWHLIDSVTIFDRDGETIVSVSGARTTGEKDEQNAADIVSARRLLPLLMARLDRVEAENARLTRLLADARSYGDEMAKQYEATMARAPEIGGRRG